MANQLSRILIVDDHPLVRAGLRTLIEAEPDLTVCGEVGSVRGAVQMARIQQPDLGLIDISLFDGDGLELIKRLRVRTPELKILVCSMRDEALFAERAINAGARGYVHKRQAAGQVLEAIRRVLAGGIYLSERMAERLINGFAGRETVLPANIDMLSNRELEVLYFIGQGLPTSTIATRLHLSIKTVNTHRGNLKRKLRLANGGELLSYAVQWHMEQAQGRPAPLPTGGHGPG